MTSSKKPKISKSIDLHYKLVIEETNTFFIIIINKYLYTMYPVPPKCVYMLTHINNIPVNTYTVSHILVYPDYIEIFKIYKYNNNILRRAIIIITLLYQGIRVIECI